MHSKSKKPDTLLTHAGRDPEAQHGAVNPPVYHASTILWPSVAELEAAQQNRYNQVTYGRHGTPTSMAFEEAVAAVEGGARAIAFCSGMAACVAPILAHLRAGDHLLMVDCAYAPTRQLCDRVLSRFGIETSFVNPRDPDAWRAALRPNTRLLFGETVGNPGLDVLNIPLIAEIAHEHKVPLMVDSTFTTPYLIKPGDLGADLIHHSATKFLCGHGTVLGGLLVDSGRFDWQASGKFPELTEPYEGFHGMVFSEESTVDAFLLRARREGLRDFGACMSPHTAWLILQGLETLPLRMERHVANARKVVEFLAAHPMVARVGWPELESHPDHALARTLLPRGCGSVFSFDLKGSRAQGAAFIEALQLFSHLANVGDCRSLVIHPASTTHSRASAAIISTRRLR